MVTLKKHPTKPSWTVRLEGRVVGEIRFNMFGTTPGYTYFPKGSKTGGKTFPTLTVAQRSLES